MRNKTRISILITAIQDCTKKEEKEKKIVLEILNRQSGKKMKNIQVGKESKIISICS